MSSGPAPPAPPAAEQHPKRQHADGPRDRHVRRALQADEPQLQVELVASDQLSNPLRREADIALRMLRPAQGSLVARQLGEVAIVAAAYTDHLARHGLPRQPADLLRHRQIGHDRDDSIERAFAQRGLALPRSSLVLRSDDQVAYGWLIAAGAGIGFVARCNLAHWPSVQALLPMPRIVSPPCWLALHREMRGNPVVRRVYDFLAAAVPPALAE